MSKKITFLLIFSIGLLGSCKRALYGPSTDKADIKGFAVKNIDFEYFNSKAKMNFYDGANNFDASMNIRIKKDSIIWINVIPMLGIEAARVALTQDSIIMMNKIDNYYSVFYYDSLSHKYNINLNFNLLQSLLIANTPYSKTLKDKVNKKGDYYVLKQENDTLVAENFIGLENQKLIRLNLTKPGNMNSLSTNYSNFTSLDGVVFPFNHLINLSYTQGVYTYKIDLKIEHQKAEFSNNSLKFPFNIPQKYERRY